MKITYPVTAINRDNSTVVLDNEAILYAFVRANRKTIGLRWTEYEYLWGWCEDTRTYGRRYIPKNREWILRDDWGRIVDPGTITYQSYPSYPGGWRSRREKARDAQARGLPIPGTGKKKRRRCHCCEVCGGSHNDARSAYNTVENNARENDFDL